MNRSNLFHKRLLRICGAMSMVLTTACNSHPPTVPIEKPFGLGQGGESVEFDFRVKEAYGHVVNLDIFFRKIDNLEEWKKEWKELEPLLGDRIHPDDSVNQAGVPITLRVRVKSIEVQGPPVDFDQTTDKLGFVDASKKFATKRVLKINNKKLEPGIYHIRVDNLHPVPEFADRTVRISIHHANQGK